MFLIAKVLQPGNCSSSEKHRMSHLCCRLPSWPSWGRWLSPGSAETPAGKERSRQTWGGSGGRTLCAEKPGSAHNRKWSAAWTKRWLFRSASECPVTHGCSWSLIFYFYFYFFYYLSAANTFINSSCVTGTHNHCTWLKWLLADLNRRMFSENKTHIVFNSVYEKKGTSKMLTNCSGKKKNVTDVVNLG